jgi:hypothetical protein
MKRARLRLAGLLLLIGVALGGAATGGYALGAASSKSRVAIAQAPRDATRSEDVAGILRQMDRRLARLEGSVIVATSRGAKAERAAPGAARSVETAEASDMETPAPALASSDPELLLAGQRVVEAGLSARRFTEAQKATLRQTLPKLAQDDRFAVMDQLVLALNRGEIDFDTHEVF